MSDLVENDFSCEALTLVYSNWLTNEPAPKHSALGSVASSCQSQSFTAGFLHRIPGCVRVHIFGIRQNEVKAKGRVPSQSHRLLSRSRALADARATESSRQPVR